MLGFHLLGGVEKASDLSSTPAHAESLESSSVRAVAEGLMGLFALGSLLLAWVGFGFSRGRLSVAYPASVDPDAEVGSTTRLPFLEVVLLFVIGSQLVGAGSIWLADDDSVFWPLWLSLCLLVVPLWPLLRANGVSSWGRALGWYRGAGLLPELGWGILAYIASIPLLTLGLGASFWLATRTSSDPHHPVSDWMTSGDESQMVATFILATLWAPWLEETVFRGAFYHYLRGGLGAVGSALISALVFSALHPQGLAGLPFLMTLAFILAWVREWRGSLVACMTMHFIHNSITLLLATVFIG